MVGNDRELQVRVATRQHIVEPVCGDRTRAKRRLLSRTIRKPIRSAASPYRDPAVAEVYRRVAVPTHVVRPARDLVPMMPVRVGDRVLDVGSGTGAFATAAAKA